MEQADRAFFTRVEQGYKAVAAAEPKRIRIVDATEAVEAVSTSVWQQVKPLLAT
jgi:dTMP kinase